MINPHACLQPEDRILHVESRRSYFFKSIKKGNVLLNDRVAYLRMGCGRNIEVPD